MSELDALRQDAKDNTKQEYGTAWSPKEAGDELSGTIETIEYVGTSFGQKYVLRIRDEDGELHALWVTGIVLVDELMTKKPGVGSLIVIIYNGKKDTKSGERQYNSFTIRVSKPNCFEEWTAARQKFDDTLALKQAEANPGGVTAPGDDGDVRPF